jgi:hypothetical protein
MWHLWLNKDTLLILLRHAAQGRNAGIAAVISFALLGHTGRHVNAGQMRGP